MKFEKLNESSGKGKIMFLYGFLMCAVLLIIINLFLTKAKYKVVDSAKLVNSTINYSNADLNVIAMYKKEYDASEYEPIDSIPIGKYELSNDSYCKVPDSEIPIKDKITFDGEEVNIKINKKGTKCYIYFNEIKIPTVQDTLAKFPDLELSNDEDCPVIDQTTGQPNNAITKPITDKDLLCKGVDDYGETYYIRGTTEKNWVKLGETYWRIIRINGDGTIRLIYSGSGTAATTGPKTVALTSKVFNTWSGDNAYVGYMFGKTGQAKKAEDDTAYNATHANEEKSSILTEIMNNWYNNDGISEDAKKWLDGEAGFCGDRTPYASNSSGSLIDKTNYGYGGINTYYGPRLRIEIDKKPSFKCPQIDKDLYTTEDSNRGNRKLPIPVGLITADEIMFAGSGYGASYTNRSYYLYTGEYYWTMSPFFATSALVFYVDNTGGYLGGHNVGNASGVRPVINLKADTPFEEGGEGTSSKPFTVKLD